jgi:hypothetical protein
MNEAIELLQTYMKILYECDQNIDVKEVSEKLEAIVKNKQFKKAINISHKLHNNSSIKLKNCPNFHCVECLLKDSELGFCIHENRLTAYEKSLLEHLISLFPEIDLHEFKFKKCLICSKSFDLNTLARSGCDCPICDVCVLTQYKNRELNCFKCKNEIIHSRFENIAKEFNEKIPNYEICKDCRLVFDAEVMSDSRCLGCKGF